MFAKESDVEVGDDAYDILKIARWGNTKCKVYVKGPGLVVNVGGGQDEERERKGESGRQEKGRTNIVTNEGKKGEGGERIPSRASIPPSRD